MFVHLHQVMEQDTEMPQEAEAHKHKEKGASPSLQIRTDIEDIACINADTNKAARTPLSPGVVTQFGEPVLDAASPALPQCHSLRNAVSAGSPGVNEWLGTTAADSPVEPAQVWTAVLIATDDDYLRKSEVRKLFRENALAPEECRLYQMPDASATDQETAERRENARRIQQRLDDAASKKCLIQ